MEEHILVGLSSAPSNARIIRTAATMAAAFGCKFTALFVRTPNYEALSEENKERLRANTELAQKLGATVVDNKMADVHVSGHACQEELKMMLSLIKPKYFVPVHGEQMHLRKHAELAEELGIKKNNIVIADIGKVIEVTDKKIKINGEVPAGQVLIDGLGVGDVGSMVLRERKLLSEDGIIVVAISIDTFSGDVVAGPDLITRGFIYVKENDDVLLEAKRIVEQTLETFNLRKIHDINAVKTKIRESLSRYLYQVTRRSPMILPVIMDV